MNKWKIEEKKVFGGSFYFVYRLRSVCFVDDLGNREYKGGWFTQREAAQAFADELNRAEAGEK